MSFDLAGDLNFISIGDVLQFIGSNGCTGALKIISKYAEKPGIFYFDKGTIINADNYLLKTKDKTGLEAAFSLFGWLDGQFEFVSQEVAKIEPVIKMNRMGIILDGLRMVDDGEVEKLGPVNFEEESDSNGKVSNIPVVRGPLIDYMYVVSEEEFFDEQIIIDENSHGNWIWTILDGAVDVIKETEQGPLPILRLSEGAFIGSLSSVASNKKKRSATIKAVNQVHLGILDVTRIGEEYSALSSEFKGILLSMIRRRQIITNSVAEQFLQKDNFKKKMTGKKSVMKQGNKDDKFFIIKKGEVSIVQKNNIGHLHFVDLKPGDFIGQFPFIDLGQEPHSAGVFATNDFAVTRLDQNKLQEEYSQMSSLLKSMIETIGNSIAMTTWVASDFQRKNKQK